MLLRTYFFENTQEFLKFLLHPGNSWQNKAPPLDIPQNCIISLRNSKAKNQDPWKFHIIFSWSPLVSGLGNSTSSLIPRNSTCFFFDTPGNPKIAHLPKFGLYSPVSLTSKSNYTLMCYFGHTYNLIIKRITRSAIHTLYLAVATRNDKHKT